MIQIRLYQPERDEQRVYALWQQTLSRRWPLSYEVFHAVTVSNPAYREGDHLVAMAGEEIVGWVATQPQTGKSSSTGHLLALLVAPAYQRQGVGRMLHDHALSLLKQRGAATIQLGGGYSYFWQGVPINLPAAWSFFQSCGWQDAERSFDLVRDMQGYATPAWVYERLSPAITIGQATSDDADAILAFEEQHFPEWFPYYQRVLRFGEYANIVLAKDAGQEIVGAALVDDPHSPSYDMRWTALLGENTGGIGTLGVADSIREQGIGLALAARVTEILQMRGIDRSYIGWTWLVDWYGKLGYTVWQEYIMSWRKDD